MMTSSKRPRSPSRDTESPIAKRRRIPAAEPTTTTVVPPVISASASPDLPSISRASFVSDRPQVTSDSNDPAVTTQGQPIPTSLPVRARSRFRNVRVTIDRQETALRTAQRAMWSPDTINGRLNLVYFVDGSMAQPSSKRGQPPTSSPNLGGFGIMTAHADSAGQFHTNGYRMEK